MSLASRIGIMNEGYLIQTGTPQELYDHPKNAFVADFLGDVSFLVGPFLPQNGNITIALRPEHIHLASSDEIPVSRMFALQVRYENATYLGSSWMVRVRTAEGRILKSLLSSHQMSRIAPKQGDSLTALFHRSHMHVLDISEDV